MKLRMQNGSIRLRLGPREVAALLQSGMVEESVQIAPGQKLTYLLRVDTVGTALSARLEAARIIVSVPAELAKTWATTDQVGMEARQHADTAAPLKILIEKDFQCIEPGARTKDADVFPHPHLE